MNTRMSWVVVGTLVIGLCLTGNSWSQVKLDVEGLCPDCPQVDIAFYKHTDTGDQQINSKDMLKVGDHVMAKVKSQAAVNVYIISFGPNGPNSLVWPADPKAPLKLAPGQEARLPEGNKYWRENSVTGEELWAVLASKEPLPQLPDMIAKAGGKVLGGPETVAQVAAADKPAEPAKEIGKPDAGAISSQGKPHDNLTAGVSSLLRETDKLSSDQVAKQVSAEGKPHDNPLAGVAVILREMGSGVQLRMLDGNTYDPAQREREAGKTMAETAKFLESFLNPKTMDFSAVKVSVMP